jgi:hypothetical protein
MIVQPQYALTTSLDPLRTPSRDFPLSGLEKLKQKTSNKKNHVSMSLDFNNLHGSNVSEKEDFSGVEKLTKSSSSSLPPSFQTSVLSKFIDKNIQNDFPYTFELENENKTPLLFKYDWKMSKGNLDFYLGLYEEGKEEFEYFDMIKSLIIYEPKTKQIRTISLLNPTLPSFSEIIIDTITKNTEHRLAQERIKIIKLQKNSSVDDITIQDDSAISSVSSTKQQTSTSPPSFASRQRIYLNMFAQLHILNHFLDEECLVLGNPKKNCLTKIYWIATDVNCVENQVYHNIMRLEENPQTVTETASSEVSTIEIWFTLSLYSAASTYYLYPSHYHPSPSYYDMWDMEHSNLVHPEQLKYKATWTLKRNEGDGRFWELKMISMKFYHNENNINLEKLSLAHKIITQKMESLLEYKLN